MLRDLLMKLHDGVSRIADDTRNLGISARGRLTRRAFLKIATGAGVATGLSPMVRRIALEPFVLTPEEELPGRATWYASTCRQCAAGCGIIVRVINGRPRKIEGNPAHPVNRGKLCARGQAGLQLLYDPDRLQSAVRQTGGRYSRQFEPISWTQAVDQLATVLSDVGSASQIGFLGGMLPDHLYVLVNRFLQALGADPPVLFELQSILDGRPLAIDASQRWFGHRQLPIYNIARAEVIFSFGANFLETWMSPVSQSVDYGVMRGGQLGGRGFMAQFEPRLSATGASADEWIPIIPGTEGLIALGLGRIIVEENLGHVGSHREHADLYRDVDVAQVASATGLSAERLSRLAHVFADANRSVAIPGGQMAGHTNAAQSFDAVMALNVIMRRLGREGGVYLPQEVPAELFTETVPSSSFAEIRDLVERMRAGNIRILFIHSSNPLYELPAWIGFREALEQVDLVVSFSSIVDETVVASDLVLPDHTYLENWGYQVVSLATDRPVISGLQPVVRPLYNTRASGDLILALATRLGGSLAAALPWSDQVAFLEDSSAQLKSSSVGPYDSRSAAGFWSQWRRHGGWWSEKPIRQEPEPEGVPSQAMQVSDAVFSGDAASYPYHLVPYASITLGDGRGANQPWLQEAPDPMTTARWNSWVEIHPQTAERLGLKDNDLVRVTSSHGELEAPVVIFPGIRPDAVAMPLGQGHDDYGRFAAGRGSSVMQLIAPSQGEDQDLLAWAATRVRLEPVGHSKELARLESLDGQGRETID
jgi:anaerobic selenocysteine-containing dehydrogenase